MSRKKLLTNIVISYTSTTTTTTNRVCKDRQPHIRALEAHHMPLPTHFRDKPYLQVLKTKFNSFLDVLTEILLNYLRKQKDWLMMKSINHKQYSQIKTDFAEFVLLTLTGQLQTHYILRVSLKSKQFSFLFFYILKEKNYY